MVETDTVWLSKDAYERLRAELEQLKTEGRAEKSAAIEAAREHGDITENAEYEVAKEEQGRLEARIRELETTLARAKVGKPATDGDTVTVGTIVTVTDGDGDDMQVYLGSREDRVEGVRVVSNKSPLGQALLGAQVGDTVSYTAPVGQLSVTVKDIRSAA